MNREPSLSAKILLFLNPDPVEVSDIALYVYGSSDHYHTLLTYKLLHRLKAIHGWRIKVPGHILEESHFDLVSQNKDLILNWSKRISLTPWTVRKLAKRKKRIA